MAIYSTSINKTSADLIAFLYGMQIIVTNQEMYGILSTNRLQASVLPADYFHFWDYNG